MEKRSVTPKKRKKFPWSTFILVCIMILGAGIMAYPTFSDWWNSFHQSRAIASYAEIVDSTSVEEMNELLEEARQYNAAIPMRGNPYLLSDEEQESYPKLLDLSGSGVMGYIQIPSIDVMLPIYHGTGEGVLQVAIGHVEWTSLPIGGEGTHSVLSGHRGLPSARLFTDLDKLGEGDVFTVTVLNQTVTYQIDQILVVLPEETDDLRIVPGKDYCTLVTCTPYGVNSHRMLVRGARIENVEEKPVIIVLPDATYIPREVVVPAVGIPMLFLFLLGMVIHYHFSTPRVDREKLLAQLRKERRTEQNEQT